MQMAAIVVQQPGKLTLPQRRGGVLATGSVLADTLKAVQLRRQDRKTLALFAIGGLMLDQAAARAVQGARVGGELPEEPLDLDAVFFRTLS